MPHSALKVEEQEGSILANPKLEKAVRLGLQMAAGLTMDAAVQEMLECLALVIDIEIGRSEAIASAPHPPYVARYHGDNPYAGLPAAPVLTEDVPREALPALSDLAPITGAPSNGKAQVRIYWDIQDLQNKILSETPNELEIQVDNAGSMVKIFRTIAQDSGSGAAPGVLLGYRPNDPNPKIPYPKASFWVTDEKVELTGVIEKLKREAADMYKVRVMPQTRLLADRPVRFAVGGEIS
jgi:hypothetical protein